MNDALPDLRALRALGRRFDLVLLSAVWMHVAPKGRERAFRILSELLGPSGLLVITLRLGETAPGLVIERTDDYVDIPFGAVGLYWLKQYLPLVLHHRLPQRPSGPGGYGWAKEAFHRAGGRLAFRPSARRPVRCGSGRHPHPRHQRRLRQHREDAGALHHSSGFRRSAVVRVGVPTRAGRVAEQTFYRWKSSTEVWKPRRSGSHRRLRTLVEVLVLVDHDLFDSVRAPARATACALASARVVLPEPATPWIAARVESARMGAAQTPTDENGLFLTRRYAPYPRR